jgi:hypothetical protein
MMTEPRIRYETAAPRKQEDLPAERPALHVVLPWEWILALPRLQQLHNMGYRNITMVDDEQGRVRIEPNE